MTAVANPPSFQQLNRSSWNINGTQNLNSMNPDDVRGIFMPRKPMQRSNSSSSISSTSSNSSTTTVATNSSQPNGTPSSSGSEMSTWSSNGSGPNPGPRKRPLPKASWPLGKPEGPTDIGRMPPGRAPMNGMNGMNGSALQPANGQTQLAVATAQQQSLAVRPMGDAMPSSGQPVLYLLSLNGTFERKTITVPFYPDSLRIGRQTNQKTLPTPANGFFDSKVLSRQHAEVWADRVGKIFIRDVKSSNGTFVNGTRLSQENRESEPHELQTGDHLELGIDIVNEDQKTVVHHKVAAKVEHAGFVNPSSNILEMNFGDLDPSNGGAVLVGPQGGMPFRSRQGSNVSMASNGRGMPAASIAGSQMNGIPGRGPFLLNTVTSEHIIKRLHSEMRGAKLQSQDLGRTGQFISTLLSKDDIKEIDKPDASESAKQLANGTSVSFRADSKTRFSDPPAPPPQQPLPEKPDVPSLKRAPTERPKSHPANAPQSARQDNLSQIIQLTEALNNAKREFDAQTARMRDLEERLQHEREARELAEDLARRLEDSAISNSDMNGTPKVGGPDAHLEGAFEPPREAPEPIDVEMPDAEPIEETAYQIEAAEAVATQLQVKLDSAVLEMTDLRQQMEAWRQRCEKAEAERDADRQSLAEMVQQIRKRDEEAAEQATAREKGRSRSSKRRGRSQNPTAVDQLPPSVLEKAAPHPEKEPQRGGEAPEDPSDKPTLSRANTITPLTANRGTLAQQEALIQGAPYASMLGVVLLGMGLMAYINGWQPPPRPSA